MNFTRLTSFVIAGALLSGTALATPNTMHKVHNAMSSKTFNMNMGPLNRSKQNGTASLKQDGKNLMVKVAVFNEPKGASEMAHIHAGSCAKLNPKPWKALGNVVNGTSMTKLDNLSITQLKGGHYAINVHDAKNPKRYVSCGDI
ncbi:MAG: hypothetical protein M3Z07_02095 [Candidatus Eremiobacteraeota bacterium]|nr:hypothetical protein [Candidatus Eremiobacteraeota bacterium]